MLKLPARSSNKSWFSSKKPVYKYDR